MPKPSPPCVSAVWGIVCAERAYTAVNRPFTPQQEWDYIASLSDREGIFLAEVDGRVAGFQSLDLRARYTDSFDHAGVVGTIILPEWRREGIGRRLAISRSYSGKYRPMTVRSKERRIDSLGSRSKRKRNDSVTSASGLTLPPDSRS